MNEPAIELREADEFGNIPNKFRLGPCLEKLMLGLGRAIAIGTHIIPNKFKSFGENETVLQTQ